MDAASQAIREDTSLVDAIERTQEAVVGEMERVGFDITN
jgi:hypothetical protein